MITKEFHNKLHGIMDAINNQLILLDALLEANRPQADTFLAEISQPIQVFQDEPEREGELPDMNDIEIPETKPELPFLQRSSEDWRNLVEYVLTKKVSEIPQVGTKFQLTSKDWIYLKNLIFYKSELFSENMNIGQILAQGVDEVDKKFFLEMEQTLKSLV